MSSLVSVIVPVFNVDKYLGKCIESIINQSYRNLEIILINDGSTDKSLYICEMYKTRDDRIKVIDKKNGGLSSARNAGLDIMNGEYVIFVDSDDFINENMVKDLLQAAISENADIVQSGFQMIYDSGEIKKRYKYINNIINTKKSILEAYFVQQSINVILCNKIYKANLFENIRMVEGKNNEDYMIMPELLSNCNKFMNIDGIYYNYLQREDSIMGSMFTEKKMDSIYASEYVVRLCKEKIFAYENMARVLLCMNCINCYITLMKSDTKDKNHFKEIIINKFNDNFIKIKRDKDFRRINIKIRLMIDIFNISPSITTYICKFYQKMRLLNE